MTTLPLPAEDADVAAVRRPLDFPIGAKVGELADAKAALRRLAKRVQEAEKELPGLWEAVKNSERQLQQAERERDEAKTVSATAQRHVTAQRIRAEAAEAKLWEADRKLRSICAYCGMGDSCPDCKPRGTHLSREYKRAEAAEAREAALREALTVALDCKGSYSGTVSELGGDPALCTKCEAAARAALATDPGATE